MEEIVPDIAEAMKKRLGVVRQAASEVIERAGEASDKADWEYNRFYDTVFGEYDRSIVPPNPTLELLERELAADERRRQLEEVVDKSNDLLELHSAIKKGNQLVGDYESLAKEIADAREGWLVSAEKSFEDERRRLEDAKGSAWAGCLGFGLLSALLLWAICMGIYEKLTEYSSQVACIVGFRIAFVLIAGLIWWQTDKSLRSSGQKLHYLSDTEAAFRRHVAAVKAKYSHSE